MLKLNLRITGKLIAGFTAIAAVLAAAVGYTSFTLSSVSQSVDLMVNLRTPASIQSTQLVGNVYSTLATLRGYLLTGNPQGKLDRAGMWKEVDGTVSGFDKLAEQFTNPENKRKWAEAKTILGEFRAAQDKAEAIAFTPDAFPATKLLRQDAMVRFDIMLAESTKMINEEEKLEATPERKQLLKTMADLRGNMTAAVAQLRMFLLVAEKTNKDQFAVAHNNYEKAFTAITGQKSLLTATQKTAFDTFTKAYEEFKPLPDRIFTLRESPQYNVPVHILVTEAAPRALKILDLLDGTKQPDGTRAGGIKSDQQAMLFKDSREVQGSISLLTMVEWILLGLGMAAAALITFICARLIAKPIAKIAEVLNELTNDRIVEVPYTTRADEVGDIAKATEVFKQSIAEKVINLRVRAGLDVVRSGVMVTDDNLNIMYVNQAQSALMKAAESEIRKVQPNFDAAKVIGTPIDVLHKDPAEQRKMMEQLTDTHEAQIDMGNQLFKLVTTPVIDTHGKRVGTVVEWKNETIEKAIEREVDAVVQAAAAGDFSQRIPTEGKTEFMLNLANAMNSLGDNTGRALDDLAVMLSAMAEGNLTPRITAEYHGMFGKLKTDANGMAERISGIVSEIKAASSEVGNAAAEISTSTTDLSQRTEEQAASLEETSASMEEISATVKKNAENAQQANQSATSTREVASRGGEVVGHAVDAMARIEESSRKISDIISVIDEIARQTNLLALNAAVEAARAGDAGRGFAVVASEVRSLAQRSSQAAKDIKDLITNSSTQVKDGVELVNRAGEQLKEIVESIKGVAAIVADIAGASAEQASGIEQVNKALTQMDEVTQQNSALVEENAASAKTLEQQSATMNDRVAFFKIDETGRGEPARLPESVVSQPAAAAAKLPASAGPKPISATMPKTNVAVSRGPARRMQTALATALKEEPDWKEF